MHRFSCSKHAVETDGWRTVHGCCPLAMRTHHPPTATHRLRAHISEAVLQLSLQHSLAGALSQLPRRSLRLGPRAIVAYEESGTTDGSVRGRSSCIYGRYRVAADVQTGRAPHELELARSNLFAASSAPRDLLRYTSACQEPLLASRSARGELVSLRPAGLDTASTRYGHQQAHTMRLCRYRGQLGHTCLNRHYCPPARQNATL